MDLRLAVIIASTRPGRVGPAVAAWVDQACRAHGGFDVTLLDLADFDLPLLDEAEHPAVKNYAHEHTKRWSRAIDAADAFVFVTPEYDYFAPAALVNAVQCLSLEWKYKVAGIVSYGGISGGLRSTQELRVLLSNVGTHTMKTSVSIHFVKRHLADGVFTPPEHAEGGITHVLDELHRWAGAVRGLRP